MDDHQYYDELIFADRPLSEKEEVSLQSHFTTCQVCQQKQAGWKQCEDLFRASVLHTPSSGFTQRWQTFSTEKTKQKATRRQQFYLAGGLIIISLLTSIACLFVFIPGTMVNLLFHAVNVAGFFLGYINQFRTILGIIKFPLLAVGIGSILLTIIYLVFGLACTVEIKKTNQGVQKL